MGKRLLIPLKYLVVFVLGFLAASIIVGLLARRAHESFMTTAQAELIGEMMLDIEEMTLLQTGETDEAMKIMDVRLDNQVNTAQRVVENGTARQSEAFEKALQAAKVYRSVYPSTTGAYTADKAQEILDEIDLPPDFMEKDAPRSLRKAVEEAEGKQRDED